MPELGESVTEGTVTRWLKKIGDPVQVDEPLVEVSTDKVDTEIPVTGGRRPAQHHRRRGRHRARSAANWPGSVRLPQLPKPALRLLHRRLRLPRRTQARTQARSRGATRTCSRTAAPRRQPAPEPKAEPAPPQPAAETGTDGAPYVTPLVRKLANENNIDLAEVTGTGVGGRIRKQDVLAAAEQKKQPKQAPAPAAAAPRQPPRP